jgi:hypothetical protein
MKAYLTKYTQITEWGVALIHKEIYPISYNSQDDRNLATCQLATNLATMTCRFH